MSNTEVSKKLPPTWNGDPGSLERFAEQARAWVTTTRSKHDQQAEELMQHSLRQMETLKKRATSELVQLRLRAGKWRAAVEAADVGIHKNLKLVEEREIGC